MARREFVGGPWDGDVTDVDRTVIMVRGKYYPHIQRVELDYGDEVVTLGIIDIHRPEYQHVGSYHRRGLAYIWIPKTE